MSESGYRRDVPHGLMFHRFRAEGAGDRWQGAISPRQFERVLEYVGVDRILSPSEWMVRLHEGRLTGADLCITFDDGLRSQLDYALPVLERLGLKAFWFIYSCVFDRRWVKSEIYTYVASRVGGMPVLIDAFFERCPAETRAVLDSEDFARFATRQKVLSPFYSRADLEYRFLRNQAATAGAVEATMDQIIADFGFDEDGLAGELWFEEEVLSRLTAGGHHVGLHTYDHPYDIRGLDAETQRDQYERNLHHLEAASGRRPDAVAHPLGWYSQESLEVLRELGVECGFRANMVVVDGSGLNPSALEIAREDSTILVLLSGGMCDEACERG